MEQHKIVEANPPWPPAPTYDPIPELISILQKCKITDEE
jgi:hypothetical protein